MGELEDNRVQGVQRIGLVGDLHGNVNWAQGILQRLASLGIKHVFQVGDFGIWPGLEGADYLRRVTSTVRRLGLCLWIIPGNHEDYSQITDPDDPEGGLERQILAEGDGWEVALLPRGYAWELGGRTFVALGGAPSIDFEMRKEGRSWWPEEMIRPSDIERLHRSAGADIMLCHDAPDGGTLQVQRIIDTPASQSMWSKEGLSYAAKGRMLMNHAYNVVKPKMFVHGHYHVPDMREGEDTTWISLGPDGQRFNTAILDLEDFTVMWGVDA